ncbi:MAG: hypothetical protein ACRDBI_07560, partial [Shewanella sp.]
MILGVRDTRLASVFLLANVIPPKALLAPLLFLAKSAFAQEGIFTLTPARLNVTLRPVIAASHCHLMAIVSFVSIFKEFLMA